MRRVIMRSFPAQIMHSNWWSKVGELQTWRGSIPIILRDGPSVGKLGMGARGVISCDRPTLKI